MRPATFASRRRTGSTVRGLAIGGFGGDGIVLDGNGHRLEGNYIGLDITGAIRRANGGIGVELESSSRNTIGGSPMAGTKPSAGPPGGPKPA